MSIRTTAAAPALDQWIRSRDLENLFGHEFEGDAQPVRTGPPARHLHYPRQTAYGELMSRAKGEADPFDDVIIECRDPATGRSVVPR